MFSHCERLPDRRLEWTRWDTLKNVVTLHHPASYTTSLSLQTATLLFELSLAPDFVWSSSKAVHYGSARTL